METISVHICSRNLHPIENACFRRGKGLEKNYDLTGIGIGIKQRSGLRDSGKILPGMAGLKNPIGDPPWTVIQKLIYNSSFVSQICCFSKKK